MGSRSKRVKEKKKEERRYEIQKDEKKGVDKAIRFNERFSGMGNRLLRSLLPSLLLYSISTSLEDLSIHGIEQDRSLVYRTLYEPFCE